MLALTIALGLALLGACVQLILFYLRLKRTERRLAAQEKTLAHAKRSVAIERRQRILEACANAISLEINNPLTSVLGLTRILQSTLKDKGAEPRHLEMLNAIEAEAQRMRSITRQVLGFVQARPGAQPVNINEVLSTVLDIFEPVAKEVFISIVRKLDPSLPSIHGSAADLEQGLAHLVNDICLGQVGPADLVVKTTLTGLRRVEIGLEFRNSGLSDAAAKPFVSPLGRGAEQQKSGLGFAIAKRVASEHHGEVRAVTEGKHRHYVFVIPPVGTPAGAKQDTGS